MSRDFLYNKGVSAIEILVGVSIAALILIFASDTLAQFLNISHDVSEKTQALYLAEEGLELMRYVRDNNWTSLSALTVGNTYYLNPSSTSVGVGSTPETIGDFSRSVILHNVYRTPTTYDIVASTTSGSALDADAKYVTVVVSWGSPADSVSLTSILADIHP